MQTPKFQIFVPRTLECCPLQSAARGRPPFPFPPPLIIYKFNIDCSSGQLYDKSPFTSHCLRLFSGPWRVPVKSARNRQSIFVSLYHHHKYRPTRVPRSVLRGRTAAHARGLALRRSCMTSKMFRQWFSCCYRTDHFGQCRVDCVYSTEMMFERRG